MRFRLLPPCFLLAAASVAPANAQSANVDVVRKCIYFLDQNPFESPKDFIADWIVFDDQQSMGRKLPGSLYGGHLEMSRLHIGPIKSLSCKDVSSSEVSCDFARVVSSEWKERHLVERFFLNDGKIVKIAMVLPSELLSVD